MGWLFVPQEGGLESRVVCLSCFKYSIEEKDVTDDVVIVIYIVGRDRRLGLYR